MIAAYRPRVQVTFLSRHLGQPKQIDFSEASQEDLLQVTTSKDIGQPVGGFTVVLTARAVGGKTWDQQIAAMDYVEIRMARDVLSGAPPIVMRGFVTSVQMSWTVVNNQPQRSVIVQGHDYGKLLVKAQMFIILNNLGELVFGSSLFGASANIQFFFQERWGMSTDAASYNMKPFDFVHKIIDSQDGILGGFIALKASPDDITPSLINDTHTEDFKPAYEIPLAISTAPLGSLQNLLDAYKAAPFYEQFIWDDASGPKLTWRLAPFTTQSPSQFITLGAITPSVRPTFHTISKAQDVITWDVGHQDEEQYSYFMTLPEIVMTSQVGARENYGEPEGSSPLGTAVWRKDLTRQFGFRPLEIAFPLLWIDNQSSQTTQDNFLSSFVPEMKDLNHWLDAAFGDQYLFENGEIELKGRPDYHIGEYVTVSETGQWLYIEGVEHTFTIPDISYRTKLSVTRGRWPSEKSPYARLNPDYTPALGFQPSVNFGVDLPTGNLVNSSTPPANRPPAPPTPPPATATMAWPVQGPITQDFGVPELGVGSPHTGIDIGVPQGTAIAAAIAGTVTFAGGDPTTGLGYHVIVQSANGTQEQYGHMVSLPIVAVGQNVAQGQTLGFVGSTGFSTGPHLHFEIDVNAVPVNPIPYLPRS